MAVSTSMEKPRENLQKVQFTNIFEIVLKELQFQKL